MILYINQYNLNYYLNVEIIKLKKMLSVVFFTIFYDFENIVFLLWLNVSKVNF